MTVLLKNQYHLEDRGISSAETHLSSFYVVSLTTLLSGADIIQKFLFYLLYIILSSKIV